jgi:uncharacterized RDD family membrane protein YckC
MNQMNDFINEGKKRHSALTKLFSPYRKLFGFMSTAGGILTFCWGADEFLIPLMALGSLLCFLGYYAIPNTGDSLAQSIRLFMRRALALLIDVFVIAFVIFNLMWCYRVKFESPDDVLQIHAGWILTAALWASAMYFVACDWRYGATIGKRLAGLRVSGLNGQRLILRRSFIRVFLSLPMPIMLGAWLFFHITLNPESTIRLLIADATQDFLVAFAPISILLLGGSQSVVDRLAHAMVRGEREQSILFPRITVRTWVLLTVATIIWATVHPSLVYVGMISRKAENPTKGLPSSMQVTWAETNSLTTQVLWIALPTGFKDATYAIRSIQIEEVASASPTTPKVDTAHFVAPVDPGAFLRAANLSQIVRVTLARDHPVLIKAKILGNYAALIDQNAPVAKRPFLSDLRLVTEHEYGIFSTVQEEDSLFCALVSNNKPVSFYIPPVPSTSVEFQWSLDHLGALLAGYGIFSSYEH